ncbi:AI-2E family transporter [Aquifex aeolicus]|uniref:Putative transport protein aq_740 n=1 Tax=Aquifex aeolicus (strain VF5) TaxID=224324 RepID=Y740_AQUAE|nr:AI-2E family transporter [Aquifex aeolicus]O66948.1 RecName: Full=Putative transport protein aq_740 [Aquifex aeolicus VF5]AAC06916.1 hypothetical protein aq_740 [Aquifex aeolicus VF5]
MNKLSLFVYLFFFLSFLFLFLYLLQPFFNPIVWAIVFGIVLYPLYGFIKRKLKSENLAAFLVIFIVLVAIVIPFTIFAVITAQQIIVFSIKVVNFVQTHSVNDLINSLKEIPFLKEKRESLEPLLNYLQSEEFRRALINALNSILTFVGDRLRSYVYTAGTSLFHVFVFLLTLFFILRDGEKVLKEIINSIPMKREDLEEILKTIYRTVLAVIYGTVGTAVAQSIMGFIGYSLAGVEFALIWALITFFAAFVPPFGAAFVWVPMDIYLFTTKGIKEGLILLFFGTFLISTMDNIVRPLVMKQGIKLPYVALFFSTIGGLIKFGFIGVFLGPIILSTMLASVKIYRRRVIHSGI